MAKENITYTFRISRELKDAIAKDATANARSINAHFVKIFNDYLAGELVPVAELVNDPRVRALVTAALNATPKPKRR